MAKVKVFKDFVQDDSFIIKISHNPVLDMTGAVFDVTLKKNLDDSVPLVLANYTVLPSEDATNGIVYIPITREATSAIPEGEYYGSIKRTIGTNTITLLRSGKDNADKVKVYKTITEKVI